MTKYIEERKELLYYRYIKSLLAFMCVRIESIIDVGSHGVDILSFVNCKKKVSIDLAVPYYGKGVESFKIDFFHYKNEHLFDVVCCFQVLEHIERAEEFSQKLLKTGRAIIVSVPYKWKKGLCKYHVQDPVDEKKLVHWFKQDPVFVDIIGERLIAVFLNNYVEENKEVSSKISRSFIESFKHELSCRETYSSIVDENISLKKDIEHIRMLYAKNVIENMPLRSVLHGDNEIGQLILDPVKVLNYLINNLDNDLDDIEMLFEDCCDIHPFYFDRYGHPAFLKEYIRFLAEKGRYKYALAMIARHKKKYENNRWYRLIFARAYEKQGNMRKALAHWKLVRGNESTNAVKRINACIKTGP